MKRVIDLEAGTAMIVTDLHGDWDAYRRYRDRFLQLQANGRADYFILTGDLIHHEGAVEEDQSLAMVLDVFALQQELGDRLIYLLGNHEMPHIYSITRPAR
jgi:predicted phosphodiesterase